MRYILFLPFFALLFSATAFSAQSWSGPGNPGAGGLTPELSCPQPWLGNPNFSLHLENAEGGASAWLGVSFARDATTLHGAPVWIDLSQMFHQSLVPLSGQLGQPGVGSFNVPFSIPTSPSLAGMQVFAQAGVLDSTVGMASSNALSIVLTVEPQIFVAYGYSGANEWFTIDPQTATLEDTGVMPPYGPTGASYGNGGQDLFLGVSRVGIRRADFRSGVPNWSTIWSSNGEDVFDAVFAGEQQRVWTLSGPSGALHELKAIDVNLSSSTYGQVVAETNGISSRGITQFWRMRNDGKRACIPGLLTMKHWIYDLDPASPTYLQEIRTLEVPDHGQSIVSVITDMVWAPNGKELWVLVQHTGSMNAEIGRYSFETNSWIDHNPTMPGIQCLGDYSTPPLVSGGAPTYLRMAPLGGFCMVGGFGTPNFGTYSKGWMMRVDFEQGSANGVQASYFSAMDLGPDSWGAALNADGSKICVAAPNQGAGDVHFISTNSLNLIGSVDLANYWIQNLRTLVWR